MTSAFCILFDILTAVCLRIHFFQDMMPCQWVNDSENFESTVFVKHLEPPHPAA